MSKNVWIPEAPGHSGLYANESDPWNPIGGKVSERVLQPSTYNPNMAKHFATKEECQAWCDANPDPVFVPREHGFS